MNFVEINGVTPCVHYTKNGTIDFTKLMHDIIHNDERNQLIATHLMVRYKTNFLVLVAHVTHAHLIEEKIHSEHVHIVKFSEVDDILKNNERIFHSRIVLMDFHTFDKIVDAHVHMHKLFNNRGGILIASPHKSIKNVINYVYQNKLNITIFDIDDNNDLLSI